MNVWKPIDKIGDWIVHSLDARAQLRWGVVIALLTIPVLLWAPFSGEPLLIYLMSGVALTLTGITVVLQAETMEMMENDSEGGGSDAA